MIRARFTRGGKHAAADGEHTGILEIEPGQLGRVFVVPPWLRDAAVVGRAPLVGAYVPYLGAWIAGGFAVLVALGGAGPEAALAMAVIALLANGALQQVVQTLAFGAALGLDPLAVLVVTIAGGSLFGMIGLVLAAPVTSAIVRITHDLAGARAPAVSEQEDSQ
jgi:predicted PurR-regulated permease PerM